MAPRILLALLTLFFLLIVSSQFRTPGDTSGAPRFFGPSDELAISPAPGRRGPYEVCERDYSVTFSGRQIEGRIFAPVRDTRTCETVRRDFNLVIIAHADGTNVSFESYNALGHHLASNAMIVVSVNRYPDGTSQGAWEIFDAVLSDTLSYLYDQSGVRDFLSDDVALIGHSAGGRSVLSNAHAVSAAGKNLRAAILMATTTPVEPVPISEHAPAFLGLHVFCDADPVAYGQSAPLQVMQSTFKVYDEADETGSPNTFGLEKDMVFVDHNGHLFQSEPFVLTYVNGFLQTHLNGHASFRRFFKNQERPPTLSGLPAQAILQMHEDPDRLAVDDFENGDRLQGLLGSVVFTGDGFGFAQENTAYELDDYSPHTSGLLRVQIDPQVGGEPARIRFVFDTPLDLTGYRYFGFRTAQMYHPELNPVGASQSFRIRLSSDAGNDARDLADGRPEVRFPTIEPSPQESDCGFAPTPGVVNDGQTKNAMRSYLISLRDFEGVDLTAVTSVLFSFQTLTQETIIAFDDLAFYRF